MKALSYINILSLDVVLGAVSCSLFLSSQWQVSPSWHSLALLAGVVWLIYTFDHLKDVYRREELPDTLRHAFHARHFTILIYISVLVLLMSIYLLLQVSEPVLRYGAALMALVGIYFLMLHFLRSNARFHKEVAISLLYAAGICLPPVAAMEEPVTAIQWVHGVQLAGLALGNLLCFSLYEYQSDRKAGFPSLMQVLPLPLGRRLLLVFLALQVLVCVLLYLTEWQPLTELVFGLMAMILLLLAATQSAFRNTTLFRLTGDAVFILPLIAYIPG